MSSDSHMKSVLGRSFDHHYITVGSMLGSKHNQCLWDRININKVGYKIFFSCILRCTDAPWTLLLWCVRCHHPCWYIWWNTGYPCWSDHRTYPGQHLSGQCRWESRVCRICGESGEILKLWRLKFHSENYYLVILAGTQPWWLGGRALVW